jgi:hypothetical protein
MVVGVLGATVLSTYGEGWSEEGKDQLKNAVIKPKEENCQEHF